MVDSQNKNQYFWNFAFSVLYLVLAAGVILIFRQQGRAVVKVSLFDFILLILATYRLAHLFVYDSVTDFLRDFLAKFEKGPGKTLSNLINCPWCTGVWVALFLAFIFFLTPYAWFFIFVLALAGAAIILKIVADRILRD